MYDVIEKQIQEDKQYPHRTWVLDVRERLLDGSFYDVLPHDFTMERDTNGTYVPLAQRRPSVRANMIKTVVNDSVSLTLSEAHFPRVLTGENVAMRDYLTAFIKESKLNSVMIEAALAGSVGSVAIRLRVLKERVFFDVFRTKYLTPAYDPAEPDKLLTVTEQYKVNGKDLVAQGYKVDPNYNYWFKRVWDRVQEIWYAPMTVQDVSQGGVMRIDPIRTPRPHKLGFVPMVWVQNLPGGSGNDGACTFEDLKHIQVQIDYSNSHNARGLKYASDPMLLIVGKVDDDKLQGRGGDNTIEIDGTEGSADAKFVEITGNASQAVGEFVNTLRKFGLEVSGGKRADPDKLAMAQSGKAMEMLDQPLIWLADKLRVSYGEGALVDLLRMMFAAGKTFKLHLSDGTPMPAWNKADKLTLSWPPYYSPTAGDLNNLSQAILNLKTCGAMSTETAVRLLAPMFDNEDIQAEIAKIKADQAESQANEIAVAKATKPVNPNPAP